jgi:uroporphyrinogen-III decarboxylase
MTHRERFFATVAGRSVDRPCFFPDITKWYLGRRTAEGESRKFGPGEYIPDDDEIHRFRGDMPEPYAGWTFLDFYRNLDWGVPLHIYKWYEERYGGGVEKTVTREERRRIRRWRSPRGELERVDTLAADGSWGPTVHLAKSVDDLAIIREVVENTEFVPRFDLVQKVLDGIGQQGVADIAVMRSPFGKLVHEHMGFEKVVYALYDDRQAVLDYLEFQKEYDLRQVRLAAESPARVVILSDHADENLIAPPYYEEFCIPYYQEVTRILHEAGKVVSTHLDGNFKGYFPLLGKTGFDLLDGCTPAPMMNYEVEELAEALAPGMRAYCGVPATLFVQHRPDEEIVEFGRRILRAFDGRGILNVGDILPEDADIEQVIALGKVVEEF